jgi:hypothetical protein
MIGLIESTEKLFADALSTMRKKNADYAGDSDSMKNFQVSALVANVKMSQGILTRLTDKTTRIGNLILKDASVKDDNRHRHKHESVNFFTPVEQSDWDIWKNKLSTVADPWLTVEKEV